jgi:putative ABC transport system permease protein
MATPSWHERLYRALLRLFPAEFRGDFGDEMADDFRQQRIDAASGGAAPVARLWTRTALDMGRRAPREHLDVLRRDASYAVRLLVRRPGFAAITLATLALGIGLNTAVFSVVSAVLLRPLPIPDSARLVRLFEVSPPPSREQDYVSSGNLVDWRKQARTLDGIASIGSAGRTMTGAGDPEQLRAMTVSEDFFRVLGARPALGRLFIAADYAPFAARDNKGSTPASPAAVTIGGQVFLRRFGGKATVVVLGHDLWQRRYGGRADVIGTTVRLDGSNVEVVGVLPADFAFTEIPQWGHADCWLPQSPDPEQRKARYLSAIGRLAPGVSLRQAQAELDVIASQLAAKYPDADKDRGIQLSPLLRAQTASVRTELWVLLGAAGCVLLIACANVANLLLAHASGRRLELATRLALGASRAHLVRQTLTESLLISMTGGAAGFALAALALPALIALAPPEVPRLREIAVDGWMLAFATIASVAVGLACGLAVVLSMDRVNPQGGGPRPSGADAGHHGRRFRQGLTIAEIALALMLVVAAGLLVRTLRALGAQELGFDPRNVISIGISPDSRKYLARDNSLSQFEANLVTRLKSAPGVVAAGIGARPLGGGGMAARVVSEDGKEHPMDVDIVSAGYLEALGAKLLSGRFVAATDSADAPRVALVNAAAARALAGTADPIGRTILLGRNPTQIVGVVADVRRGDLERPPGPAIYLSHLQPAGMTTNNLLVRTSGEPRDVLPSVRAIMRQLDPDQPLTRIGTLQERIDEVLAPRRFMLRLIGLFSILALGLAMLGVYGVMAESVAQRVPEIGIRVALGATPGAIRHLVIVQGGWMVVLGLAGGLAGALTLRRAMATLVFGVPTTDPLAYAIACVCLAAATIAACAIPANRAASLDPIRALRQE